MHIHTQIYNDDFAGRVVFHIPDWLHHILMGGRILLKNTLEAYTDYYLKNKLEQLFQEHRLVSLITLLRGECKLVLSYTDYNCSIDIKTLLHFELVGPPVNS